MIRAGALALLCATGCHETVALPSPDLTGAGSALLLFQSAGVATRVELVDTAVGLPSFSRSVERDTEVTALAYPCAPSVYGLAPGPLALLDRPATNRRLPSPLRAATLRLDGEADTIAWTPADVTDARLDETLRRVSAEVDLCPDVVIEAVDFDPDPSESILELTWVDVALPLGDGRALIVTNHEQFGQRVFVVDRMGVVTTSTLAYRNSRGSSLPAGFLRRDEHGGLWHISTNGEIARGTLADGLDVVATFDVPGMYITDVALLEAPAGPGLPTLLVTSTSEGGQRVTEIHGDTARELVQRRLGSTPVVAVVSRDEVVVANAETFSRSFTRLRREGGEWTTTQEEAPPSLEDAAPVPYVEITGDLVVDGRGRVTAFDTWVSGRQLLERPDLGEPDNRRFIGTGILEQRDGRWTRNERLVFDDTLSAIDATRVDDGLTVVSGWADGGRADTRVALYQASAGLCAVETFTRPFGTTREAPAAVALDEDTVLVVPDRTAGRAFIWRRVARPPACVSGE